MTDDRIPPVFERRVASSLHAAAPTPAPDLADRVMRKTSVTRQRRRWGGLIMASALAATAAVAAAVVIGLQLGGLLPQRSNVGNEQSAPAATTLPSASDAPASQPTSTVPSPSPSPSDGGLPGGMPCTNDEFGFTVDYPAQWWANEAVTPEDPALTPIPACTYFAEEPVELQPNAGLPRGIVVIVELAEDPAGGEPTGVEVIEQRETEVGGRHAVVEELEWTEDTAFQRAGDRTYSYRIELADGQTLTISTDTAVSGADAAAYAQHREVLDRMMRSLAFTDR